MIAFGGVTYAEMADSIDPANLRSLPFVPDAYLGYVDGRWPDYAQIAAEHGDKPCLGLTVFGSRTQGDGSDDEPGNTTVAQTPAVTKAELARGVVGPIVYCPASWATQMVAAHSAAGIDRASYRLLTAHYQGPTAAGAPLPGMHICGPGTCGYGPGSDGTQWQNAGPYDRSILALDFLPAVSHPGTPPIPKGTAVFTPPLHLQDIASSLSWPHGGIVLLGVDGSIYNFGGSPYLGGANGKPYFTGRTAAELVYRAAGTVAGYGEGYTIIDTANERYNF